MLLSPIPCHRVFASKSGYLAAGDRQGRLGSEIKVEGYSSSTESLFEKLGGTIIIVQDVCTLR